MLTTARTRRALAPVLLTGLLVTTTLSAAPPAAAAAAAAGEARVVTADRDTEPLSPRRVLPGVLLRAKPPRWVLPVRGYRLTGRFGQSSGFWSSTHTGLDFAAPEGTQIRSISPGVVSEVAYRGSFGNRTEVRLDDGTVLWYCHQSEYGVEVGQRLAPGDLIGYVGSTGNVSGPHLHLEVQPARGEPVDPEAWLPAHGVTP